MRYRSLLLACLAVCLVTETPAAQLLPLESSPERPLRLEGYWDRTREWRAVIGEVTMSVTGRAKRRFGVTVVQAYKPEEEGMQIFRFTSDHPVTLLVRGDGDVVERLFATPPDRKIVVFGTYNRGSGTFLLGSVDVGAGREDRD